MNLIDEICPSSKPCFDFHTQDEIGKMGEADFARFYAKDYSPQKSSIYAYDFVLKNGETVEVKTDKYSMRKTPNFFMEEISDIESGKSGGPFRAFEDGVTYFVYYFIQNRMFFWFEVPSLYAQIRKLIAENKFEPKFIKNRRWTTKGYAINRDLFNPVLIHQDQFPLDVR